MATLAVLPVDNIREKVEGTMSFEKEYFIDRINEAMELMQRAGHITHYMDFNSEDGNKGVELMLRVSEALDWKTKDQWIKEGVPLADLEKCEYFLRWQRRVDVAGVYKDDEPVCAECLTEKDWDSIDQYKYEDLIFRSNYESFVCSVCGENRNYTDSILNFDEPISSEPEIENPQKQRKVGRNEPCPCGSDKKYKKCCGE